METVDPRPIEDERATVLAVLRGINAAWLERRWEDLAARLDEDMVFEVPGAAEALVGREAIVGSYREFMGRAEVRDFVEADEAVHCWGDTAVVSYTWTMTWRDGDREHTERGRDAFVLRRSAGAPRSWCAVWRTMSFEADRSD